MKIAFISSRFPPDFIGGGELSTKYIAQGIVSLGHEVDVLCGAPVDADEEVGGVKIRRRRLLHGLWKKPLFELNKSSFLSRLLKKELKENYDIIHAHDFRSAQALSLLKLLNSVVTVRDYAPICGTTNNMWFDGQSCDKCSLFNVCFRCHRTHEASILRKPFRIWQYKYNLPFRYGTYAYLDNQIYISNSLKSKISTRLTVGENSVVIANPVAPEWLSPVVPVLKKRITYAGTVDDYKGLGVLIEAFRVVGEIERDAELFLVGKGNIEKYQRQISRFDRLPRIFFTEKQSQEKVQQYFDESAVIVQPSIWEEPFGRTIIEAYARGRAVVASGVGGIKETFKEGTGFLVQPGKSDELAKALLNVIRNISDSQKMGHLGRVHVEKNYLPNKIAQNHIDFYRSII